MNIYLETMGCQMNRLDSELVVAHLRAAGHTMTDDSASADVVLYNTCSVRDHAEQKVLSRIGADAQRKKAGRKLLVGVLGCMAQRLGQTLTRSHRAVDIVCGPGQLDRLPDLLAEAAGGNAIVALDPGRKQQPRPVDADDFDQLDLARDAKQTTSSAQAFVRVMRGCDKFCTYCIVPFVRGPEVSRSPDHVDEEVRRLVGAGRSEITLLGQTVNRYRWANGETSVRFGDLLARLADIDGLRRLRFVTSHPLDFTDDILQAMADLPNVCEYLHCPAQSGSDPVLQRMNRGYTRAQYDDLVDRARDIVPNIVLAGDFIVGFPGETDSDHDASADLIRRCGYKNSFIFKYSPRPDTPAAKTLADDIDETTKKRRNNDLLAVQAEVGLAHHRRYIGQRVEVLVEGPSPRADKQPSSLPDGQTQMMGRTRRDHIVIVDAARTLAGQYVNVDITDATALVLTGTLVDA
ncbi:MAG: tRNA (N6-isopentenyl adenosine(37)-C2)-methylthiotransferase MiaB [Planctomycetota bacterium]|jgi:tRNA-2-methylthio-N6-dimethylallyladenosine synthase